MISERATKSNKKETIAERRAASMPAARKEATKPDAIAPTSVVELSAFDDNEYAAAPS